MTTDAGVGAPSDGQVPPHTMCVCDPSVVLSAACRDECAGAFAELLYADRQLPSFYLTIPNDNGAPGANSWDVISSCTQEEASSAMPPARCDEQVGSFHAEYDPEPDDAQTQRITTPEIEVGIRRKGRATWQALDQKPALKVKFTAFGGERFMELSSLTLNSMIQDPSGLRERLAYRVFHGAGVVASRANNARVYVRRSAASNYEYYGLYANIQTLDRRFLEQRFGKVGGAVGNLYDTYNYVYFSDLDRSAEREQAGVNPGAQEARFQLETNEAKADHEDLTALIDAVYALDPGADNASFVEGMLPVLDVDAFLRMFATQALIADWDGFAGARNNYKLYHELARDRFIMFPWGVDQTFGYQDRVYYANWSYALNHQDSRRPPSHFMTRCARDTVDCYARYLVHVKAAVTSFDASALMTVVNEMATQIEQAMLDDTRKPYSEAEFRRNVDYVRHFVGQRAACVTRQLSGLPCAQLECPPGSAEDCKAL